jgi:L-fuculose-phosphate aldolase
MDSLTELIPQMAQRLFERRLLDMAGGNISARQDGRIFITRRYSGSLRHWQIGSADVLEGGLDDPEFSSHPALSREGKVHLAVYRAFDVVGAVIHAHPFHVLPFCSAERAIEPVLEQTRKFGVIPVVEYAPAHSEELARNVLIGLRGKEDTIRRQAAAVLIPQHGIVVAGKDLLAAVDALERIDWNAHCIIARAALSADVGGVEHCQDVSRSAS